MTVRAAHRSENPGRVLDIAEALALFVLGFAVMHLFYAGTVGATGAEIGVPAHDSFYHVAMASILPDVGAMSDFPWLAYTYFRDQGHAFVSHHWGFHLLLVPFVKLAEATTGDGLAGGRWAMAAVFGANLVLFHLLLRRRKVPLHWLWIALFFLLPDQFYTRHGFVRSIGASLLFMQLILLGLFARRIWLVALSVAGYVHLYLGAVFFGPALVAIYAAAQALGPAGDRRIPWKLIAAAAAAWGIGVITYPYAGGMFEFLRMQVFGTGLSPDIEVGREWKPYSDAWFLVTIAGTLLLTWVGALFLRLRMGPRLSAQDATLLVLQFGFLLLTFKARRFIEYWPPICLLSAAYLASDPLTEILAEVRAHAARWNEKVRLWWAASGAAVLALSGIVVWSRIDARGDSEMLLQRWPLWVAPLLLLAIGAAQRAQLASTTGTTPRAWSWVRTGTVAAAALLLPASTFAVGTRSWDSAVSQLRCYYDLDAVRSVMGFLQASSQPGDLVFTDDWDIFPVFFYHNRHNRYIVGLDPKFTHQRDPDLWNRYVKISRGEVPSTIELASEGDDGVRGTVALEDIREEFHAQYVIADQDHHALADALIKAPEFAELVYPSTDYEIASKEPYVVFRIRDRDEPPPLVQQQPPIGERPIYLSELRPLSVSQGWGELGADQTVDGNPVRLDGQTYARGVGTHAPARILYEIPEGYAWFEAVVGVDDETGGRGTTVASIVLDGRPVYQTPELRGGGSAAIARIPLEGARQIQLEASATADGQRFDHVSWADARFLPSDMASNERPLP